MAQEVLFRELQVAASDVEIRKIGTKDLWQALKEGYEDFNAKPSFGAFLIFIYPLFALLFSLLVLGEDLLYLAFPVVAGFTLLGPVACVALFEMSRRREQDLDLTWRSSFNWIHSSAFAPIVALSVVMMLLYSAWVYMAQFMYLGLFGADPPASMVDLWSQVLSTRRGAALAMYGTGVGFLFAFSVLAISVIAFPLLLDKHASSATAIAVSVRAVTTNPLPMAIWGVTVVLLLAAGAVVFLVGLAAVLPILGHATWHLYRKVVAP